MSADSSYNTFKAASSKLIDSLLGGSALNYVGHRACVRKASLLTRCAKIHFELGELARQKELAGGQERNRLHRETRNGACLSAVPHRLNSTELSRKEFRDILRLIYGLMTQGIPATCDGCGKKFSIENTLSCPKGGLVLTWHDDIAKEWGDLRARDLVPSAITYEPKINSRTVQGERTGSGERQERGLADGGTETVGEAQEGQERTVNGAARLLGKPGQVVVLAELRADVSVHSLWKRGPTRCLTFELSTSTQAPTCT